MEAYDGELDVGRAELVPPVVDILDPFLVVVEAVGGDANELHTALLEVGCPVCTDTSQEVGVRGNLACILILVAQLHAGAQSRAYLRATSASSVVQTGVKSPGCEKRMAFHA